MSRQWADEKYGVLLDPPAQEDAFFVAVLLALGLPPPSFMTPQAPDGTITISADIGSRQMSYAQDFYKMMQHHPDRWSRPYQVAEDAKEVAALQVRKIGDIAHVPERNVAAWVRFQIWVDKQKSEST